MPSVIVDECQIEVPPGASLLDAVRLAGVNLPTLCAWEGLPAYGACRLCLVGLAGPTPQTVAACAYPAADGLVVETHAPQAVAVRRVMLELLLARCPTSAAIRDLAAGQGVTASRFPPNDDPAELCVLCGLCVRICREQVGAAAISFIGRGAERHPDSPFHLQAERCIGCGACAAVCPTGAVVMEDLAGLRRLPTWNTVLPLETCHGCGQPFAPRPLLDYPPAVEDGPERSRLCPSCRRRITAGRLVEGMQLCR